MWDQIKDKADLIASPLFVLLLRLLPIFQLRPFGHWNFQVDLPVFVAAFGGAVIARLFPQWNSTNRVKATAVFVGIILLLVFLYLYTEMGATPPTPEELWWFKVKAVVVFFGSYVVMGYTLSRIIRQMLKDK